MFFPFLLLLAVQACHGTARYPQRRYPSSEAAYKSAYQIESANWVSNVTADTFYNTPANFSSYSPGDSLRLEHVSGNALRQYRIPPGLTLYRILYQSQDMDDRPVPASAYILLPYSRSPQHSELNLIVWTHGTSGIERQCAPSVQRNLYYDFDGPFAMALRGYAVIGPDYAGQGSDTPFNYLAGPSHAADVAYAVMAARQALPKGLISNEWVVVGHSEGGLTAWATNEREVTKPTGGFLGAVAIAPALQNLHIIRYGKTHNKLGRSLFYSSYTLTTIARLDPSVDVTRYFSDIGLERTRLAATACYSTAGAVFSNLTFSDIFKDESWLDSSWAEAWENRTAVAGDKPLAQPLLLIEGLAETAVFKEIPEAVFANHCSLHPGSQVHLSRYPGMDHDPLAYVSQYEYFEWISARFRGVPTQQGCTNETIRMVFDDPTSQTHDFRLLVQT